MTGCPTKGEEGNDKVILECLRGLCNCDAKELSVPAFFLSLASLFGFEMSFQLQAIAERDITTVMAGREKENCVIPFRLAEHLSSTF